MRTQEENKNIEKQKEWTKPQLTVLVLQPLN